MIFAEFPSDEGREVGEASIPNQKGCGHRPNISGQAATHSFQGAGMIVRIGQFVLLPAPFVSVSKENSELFTSNKRSRYDFVFRNSSFIV